MTIPLDAELRALFLEAANSAAAAYFAALPAPDPWLPTPAAAAEVREAALMRTYHLGAKPTPGRGYDDRLRMRLGCGVDLARELVTSGRIRAQYLGNRYSVCEQAVRAFYAAK